MFIVGAWDEVLEVAVDLRTIFEKYTGGALTFSAGFGMFDRTFPVSRMVELTAILESRAKGIDDKKNAISLFGEDMPVGGGIGHTYKWDVFIEKVVNEKLRAIEDYFEISKNLDSAKGNAFLYRLMGFVVRAGDRVNIARCAYLLGRLIPNEKASDVEREAYSRFSRDVYKWILNEEDRRQLLTAINIYLYLNRNKEDKND